MMAARSPQSSLIVAPYSVSLAIATSNRGIFTPGYNSN